MSCNTVFEIQFNEVEKDVYAWDIVKNEINFKNTGGKIELHNLKIHSRFKYRLYNFDLSIFEWIPLTMDTLIDSDLKLKIEDFVNYINKKYANYYRWRADKGQYFYYITSNSDVAKTYDDYSPYKNSYYELGNYFETEEEAREIIDSIEWKYFWKTIRQEKEILNGK